jgi:hypothetical protein
MGVFAIKLRCAFSDFKERTVVQVVAVAMENVKAASPAPEERNPGEFDL